MAAPEAKRLKLDTKLQQLDATLIPDDILFHIFRSIPRIRARMRLSLVSKRFRRLLYSKRSWSDITQLSVQLNRWHNVLINGRENLPGDKRTACLEMLLACADITQLRIVLPHPECREGHWLKVFLRRFQSNNHQLRGLSFEGSARYVADVLEPLIARDGQEQAIHICLRPDPDFNRKIKIKCVDKIWPLVEQCDGLSEFKFECQDLNLYYTFEEEARDALLSKDHLKTLSLRVPPANDWRWKSFVLPNIAAVAESCPSLVQLDCQQFNNQNSCFPLLKLLSQQCAHRLRWFDITFGRAPINPELIHSLPNILPNLEHSVVDATFELDLPTVVAVVKSFLVDWQLGKHNKLVTLDFKWKGHPIDLSVFSYFAYDLELLYDSLVMARDGRWAFVRGDSVVVAFKFIFEQPN